MLATKDLQPSAPLLPAPPPPHCTSAVGWTWGRSNTSSCTLLHPNTSNDCNPGPSSHSGCKLVTSHPITNKLLKLEKCSFPTEHGAREGHPLNIKDCIDLLHMPSRLDNLQSDTSNIFKLLKPSRGCKDDTPQLCKLSSCMFVHPSMPARLTRSGADHMYNSINHGLMPSKLLSLPPWPSTKSCISFKLLSPAKPCSEVAPHALPHSCKSSSWCNVLRGCRLLKL
jgi:hypothetical protein